MITPEKYEVVSLVLTLEDVVKNNKLNAPGLRFMCKAAADMIRRLRPDLAFKEVNE